jgi:hypothetical protein
VAPTSAMTGGAVDDLSHEQILEYLNTIENSFDSSDSLKLYS